MTTEQNLADRLEELREKATPGPWELRTYQSGTTAVVMREWPAPNEHGAGYIAAHIDARNIGQQDENEIQRERYFNADLIRTLVNNLPAIISALRGRESVIDWRALGAIIHEEAQEYELRDPDHTPTDFERFMLEDFGNGIKEKLVRAAISSTSQVIAEGMVMVPREPTLEMMDAGYDATRRADGYPEFADAGFVLGHARTIYRAMIKAAKGGE